MSSKKFIQHYFEGKSELTEIPSFLEELEVREKKIPNYEYLGLTKDEYMLWENNKTFELSELLRVKKLRYEIIEKAKIFFRDEIAKSHEANTGKLVDLNSFNLNPFLDKYKANFLTGNNTSTSIAKALIYPRVLGTSINTTFGSKMQKFCSEVLEGFSSTTSGIDIEFIDFLDGRKKYCQIKAGPNTINKDDIVTIEGHFQSIKNLARTNNLNININDLVVGIFYGEPNKYSTHYKKISESYPVFIGKEFWYRLTGDKDFYEKITDAIGELASEYDSSEMLNRVITELAKKIKDKFNLDE